MSKWLVNELEEPTIKIMYQNCFMTYGETVKGVYGNSTICWIFLYILDSAKLIYSNKYQISCKSQRLCKRIDCKEA